MLIIGLIFISLAICQCSSVEVPSVSTQSTTFIGHYKLSGKGAKYEAYEGIPYALPPTGDRRFEPPVPVSSWQNETVTRQIKDICLQYDRERPAIYIYGSEDCLYMNIYVPIRKDNTSLPVIFYIHGGGFQYGGEAENVAPYLVDHNVITVQIHYRLGTLGFLSTEDEVIPGNMGLKDQALALKWVHENIRYFGGDPKRITLTGLSAGGASVHYHYLSPMSKGLFRSGISFSGTAFNDWAQIEDSRNKAIELAKISNCPVNDTRVMIQCLKQRPGRSLVEAQPYFMPWKLNPFTPFGPVVEKSSKQPFINRAPIDIISSGDVYDAPWITSVVSEEGLYPVAEFTTAANLQEVNDNWETIAPYLLDYNYTIPKAEHADVARKIRKHYFQDKAINKTTLPTLIHLVGDRIFNVDAEKAARAQAKANKNPVWFYYYSYRAANSLSEVTANSTENFGVCHGDDVYLVLANSIIVPNKTRTDLAMHNDLIKIWVSVAEKGVPDIGYKWAKVDPSQSSLNYLHITGPGALNSTKDANFAQKKFWSSINFNENKRNSGSLILPLMSLISLSFVTTLYSS